MTPPPSKPPFATRCLVPALALGLVLTLALPAAAQAFERIRDADRFARLIDGRELARTGIRLQVLPQGQIAGRGLGYPVTGEWRWQDGYFCRTLDWGGSDLGHDCQAVLAQGSRVRFVAERGAGRWADFSLR